MEIKWIEKIKLSLEKIKLKRMKDGALIKELEEKLKADETRNIHNIVGYLGDNDKQLKLAKELIESGEINIATKQQVIDTLPNQMKKELFKESVKTKELLAKKDISTFLQILIKDKNLQPYDELYYRVDKAFSDSQLAYMFGRIHTERPEAYSEEKILGVIAKQIATKMKKYETFFPSHLQELTNQVIINYNQVGQRTFDILEEEDRKKLLEAIKEEAEVLKSSKKIPITEVEKQRLTPKRVEEQIDRLVQFATERQEELRQQGVEQFEKE